MKGPDRYLLRAVPRGQRLWWLAVAVVWFVLIEYTAHLVPGIRFARLSLLSLLIIWRLFSWRTLVVCTLFASLASEAAESSAGSTSAAPAAFVVNALLRFVFFLVIFYALEKWLRSEVRVDRERQLVGAMQRLALTPHLSIDDLKIDVAYRAGKDETFGGDWYDAFTLPNGQTVLNIGDVAGSGLEAASTMIVARQAMRATALAHQGPASILATVDLVLQSERLDDMVTASVALYDPVRRQVDIASAGHLPLFFVQPDGSVTEPPIRNDLPLGVRQPFGYTLSTFDLSPGATMVFYTDGLVEHRRDVREGIERLRAVLRSAAFREAAKPAALLLEQLIGGDPRDDVAVLVVRAEPMTVRPALRGVIAEASGNIV